MGVPVLQLRNIQKRFLGVHALKGVSLDVHPGEVVALLGENGAGKSTLMKIAGGIEQPDSGEVLIDGARVVVRDVHTATSHGIAFIHQELNLLDNLDVAGNVLLGREPTGWGPLRLVDRRKMHAIVQPYLAQLGLSISAGHGRRRTVDRAAAARRDCESPLAEGASAHHGRADVEPDTGRDVKAARDRRWTCARMV